MARKTKPVNKGATAWRGAGFVVSITGSHVSVVAEHPVYGKMLLDLIYSGPAQIMPATTNYWQHKAEFTVDPQTFTGIAEIKTIAVLIRADLATKNSTVAPDVVKLESSQYRHYCEAAQFYGTIFPPPRSAAGAGRAPKRYAHLKKIYKEFLNKSASLNVANQFQNGMSKLRELGLISAPKPAETVHEETKNVDRSRRRLQDAFLGQSPDLKKIKNTIKKRHKPGRSKGVIFPGIVSTVDSMFVVDDQNTPVSKTNRIGHESHYLSVEHKKLTVEDFRIQRKSFNKLMEKQASSVLRPLTMWTEGITSTTKVFKILWYEIQDLIRIF